MYIWPWHFLGLHIAFFKVINQKVMKNPKNTVLASVSIEKKKKHVHPLEKMFFFSNDKYLYLISKSILKSVI